MQTTTHKTKLNQQKDIKNKSLKQVKDLKTNQVKQKTKEEKGNQVIQLKQSKQKKELVDKNIAHQQKRQISQAKIVNKQQKQVCQPIQLELNLSNLAPVSFNVQLVSSLQIEKINENSLIRIYSDLCTKSQYILNPIKTQIRTQKLPQQQTNQVLLAIFCYQNIKKYEEVYLDLTDQFIYQWVVQIFYNLHPHKLKIKEAQLFLKIEKANTFIPDSPFMKFIKKRNKNLIWNNPLKILIKETVKDQQQYLQQLVSFDEQLVKIKSFQLLQSEYKKLIYQSYQKQILNIKGMSLKLNKQLQRLKLQFKDKQQDVLNEQTKKWLIKQLNLDPKCTPYVGYRASSCLFQSHKFWQEISTSHKNEQIGKLLVIQIQHKEVSKLIGFYFQVFPSNITSHLQNSGQASTEYVVDKGKKCKIISINDKTIHQLIDSQYAYTFNHTMLLCIGKCDIILSNSNIVNLCYFPVSYAPDHNHQCFNADLLCGGKKFNIIQIFCYRFKKS